MSAAMSRGYNFWRFFVVGIMGAITMFVIAIVEMLWPSLNIFVYYFHSNWLKILQTLIYWFISPYILNKLGCKR